MQRLIRRIAIAAVMLGLWLVCGKAGGEQAADHPADNGMDRSWKTLKFDFDIRFEGKVTAETRKPERLQPEGWERIITKEGSPDFDQGLCRDNVGEILPDDGWKNWYLKLTLESGKISYQTCSYPGAAKGETFIPVNPAKSYDLTAKIRTEGFEQPFRPTGAYVSILWFEKPANDAVCRYADGTPIIFATAPVTSDTRGEWREVRLSVDMAPPGAMYAKIRCTLEGKGIRSAAMFDDVVLSEGPRVALDAGRAVPLFGAGEEIRLAISLDGLEKGKYSEEITTEDLNAGSALGTESNGFDVAEQSRMQRSYSVNTPALGVFRLRYTLKDAAGDEVAERSIVVARVPDPARLKYADKFGVSFNFFDRPYPFVGNYISALGAGMMKTELWADTITGEKNRQELLRFAGELRRRGVRTAGVLGSSPIALTKTMGLSVPLIGKTLFDQPKGERQEALWAFLKEDLAPWADLLDGVQLAPDGDTSFNGPVGDITANFATKMPPPLASARCVVPVGAASADALPQGADVIALRVPAGMSVEDLSRKIEQVRGVAPVWVTLEMRPEGSAQIDDMLKKITVCLAGGAEKIFLPLVSPGGGLVRMIEYPNESAELTPAFAALRFFMQAVDGAAFVEKFEIAPMEVYLFEKDGESLAVVWSSGPRTSVPVFWGEGLKMYDLFGNRLDVKSTDGQTLIEGVGLTPRIVNGMNPQMMRTWRSLRLLTQSIEAGVEEQPIEIAIENHFGKEMDCAMKLAFDAGLEHLCSSPHAAKFTIAPGAAWSSGAQFTLKPSISDTVGEKTFQAVVTVDTEEGRFVLKKTFSIQIVPSQLGLRLVRISRADDGGLAVRVAVTNNGAARTGVNVYASAGDDALNERHFSIPRLEAGQEKEVEFRVPSEGGIPPARMWLGLREINGRRFVNINLDRGQIEAALEK